MKIQSEKQIKKNFGKMSQFSFESAKSDTIIWNSAFVRFFSEHVTDTAFMKQVLIVVLLVLASYVILSGVRECVAAFRYHWGLYLQSYQSSVSDAHEEKEA